MKLLMSLHIVQSRECFPTFRTLMRPLTTMALLMILFVKIASERLAADTTVELPLCGCNIRGLEALSQVGHLGMEGFHMPATKPVRLL